MDQVNELTWTINLKLKPQHTKGAQATTTSKVLSTDYWELGIRPRKSLFSCCLKNTAFYYALTKEKGITLNTDTRFNLS